MDEGRRGFAGFESLVTDLSDLPPLPPLPDKPPAAPAAGPAHHGDAASVFPRRPSPKKAWAAVSIFAVGFGLLFVHLNNLPATRPAPVTPNRPFTFTTTPPSTAIPPYTFVPPAVAPEQKPPAGQDNALSAGQLRYCLAQSARLDGGEKAADKTSQAEISRFNALIEDYNVRCVRYRYRASDMQIIKAEVEGRRAQLEREGAALVRSSSLR